MKLEVSIALQLCFTVSVFLLKSPLFVFTFGNFCLLCLIFVWGTILCREEQRAGCCRERDYGKLNSVPSMFVEVI